MADIVQRWRVVYRRGHEAVGFAQRAELEAWEAALAASGLPVAMTAGSRSRPRLAMPPPLPAGLTGERELLDLTLVERRTTADVRAGLGAVVPAGHEIVELFDVWSGAPPLPAQVVAVDYAMTVRPVAGPAVLRAAVARILAAPRLERVRPKSDRSTAYDLRHFILGVDFDEDEPEGHVFGMRLAVHQEQGTGRPDEVLAAIAEELGQPLEMTSGARTRIWTADESPIRSAVALGRTAPPRR